MAQRIQPGFRGRFHQKIGGATHGTFFVFGYSFCFFRRWLKQFRVLLFTFRKSDSELFYLMVDSCRPLRVKRRRIIMKQTAKDRARPPGITNREKSPSFNGDRNGEVDM